MLYDLNNNRGHLLLAAAILECRIPRLDPTLPSQLALIGKLNEGDYLEDSDVRLAKSVVQGINILAEKYWPGVEMEGRDEGSS